LRNEQVGYYVEFINLLDCDAIHLLVNC